MSFRVSLALVAAVGLVTLAQACDEGSTATGTSDPEPPDRPEETPEEAAPPPPTPTLASRVFVDVSGSMHGFIRRNERTVSSIHQSIDDTLAAAGRAGPRRCIVGAEVSCDEGVPATSLGFDSASLYTAESSRLDAVLRRAPVPERIDPDHPPAPDMLDDAYVTIIVSDGMQVSSHLGEGAQGEAGCAAAADPYCIATLLASRVRDGFGVWLIHQYLSFDGTHFAEMPLDSGHHEQATAHAAETALDPRYNGVEFRVGRLSTNTRAGTSSFAYRGVKPLLLLVIARDAELGRRVVSGLVQRLRAQPLAPGRMSPELTTQALELAPFTPARYRLTALEAAPRDDQASIATELLREVRIRESTAAPNGDLTASLWCGTRGRTMLYLRYEATPGALPLPPYLAQSLTLTGPVTRSPLPDQMLADPTERPDASAFRLGLNCAPLRPGRTSLGYELSSVLALDETRAGAEWWSELTSTDSYRSPERAYGLRELVLGVVRASVGSATRGGRARITVEREAE